MLNQHVPKLALADGLTQAECDALASLSRAALENGYVRPEVDGSDFEEILYEGYGPGGVAVMVECLTDNRNRTVADVRHAFTKFGGNLGADGSVAYLFNKVGLISFATDTDEDRLMELAIEAGAEDVLTNEDGSFDVLTDPGEFPGVRDALVSATLTPELAEVTMRASTTSKLDEDEASSMLTFLEMLEDLDDVQNVSSNAEIPDDILEKL